MISRRSFLKSVGVAAAALGAGYGVGKITNNTETKQFTVHGFLPDDESVVKEVVALFNKKVNASSSPVIYADKNWANVISSAYKKTAQSGSFVNSGNVTFRVTRISEPVDGDIILSDNRNVVYDPQKDFSGAFIWLRKKIKNRKGVLMFSAEYRQSNLFTNLLNNKNKVVVIENSKGIVDKINLNSSYKNFEVSGPQGKTGIKIVNGTASVHNSTCRHKLCEHAGYAAKPGDMIACAPNKVLLRVDFV